MAKRKGDDMRRNTKLIIICLVMLMNVSVNNSYALSGPSYILGEIELLLDSGDIEIYPIYKSPFVDDNDQIYDTLSYLFERVDVKEILKFNDNNIEDTEYGDVLDEIKEKQKDSNHKAEDNYGQDNSGSIIKRDENNNIIQPDVEKRDVDVIVNGKLITTEHKGFIENNRTMVPFRIVAESLGADVGYNFRNEDLKVIWSIRADTKIDMRLGDLRAYRNEKMVYMDVAPLLYNDKTYIPLRYLAELFNCEVEWDAASYTVKINTRKGK